MSGYRDQHGRYRQRDGLDILDDIGAGVMMLLMIWGAAWLIGIWQAVEVTR
jgi:hypothetical protein